MAAASGIAPDSPRLQRGANLSQLHSHGPSARFRAAVYRLSADCSAIELRRIGKNGRAPRCCPGCLLVPNEAGLLTPSRAISENWLRRPDSNRRYAAYETAALPLGYSAVDGEKLARRPGAAPDPQGFGDLAAQADARRVVNT